ncbi:hypothetical protein DL98DRAFT_443270, partial [Cadophora sp. DSE1049]
WNESPDSERELEAISFVCRHTSIPTPTVLEVHIDEDPTNSSSWFSMSAIAGYSLTNAWPSMKEEARRATQADLHRYLQELRALTPPQPPCLIFLSIPKPTNFRRW